MAAAALALLRLWLLLVRAWLGAPFSLLPCVRVQRGRGVEGEEEGKEGKEEEEEEGQEVEQEEEEEAAEKEHEGARWV